MSLVRHVGINGYRDLFICTTDHGFAVFRTVPLVKLIDRVWLEPLSIVEILSRTNIFAVITIARPSEVLLWDDARLSIFGQFDATASIISIRLLPERLIVTTADALTVLTIESEPQQLYRFPLTNSTFETVDAVLHGRELVVVFPAKRSGSLQVSRIPVSSDGSRSKFFVTSIKAHAAQIHNIVLSASGRKVATASANGTIIRIWDVNTTEQIAEHRRGTTKTKIKSMQFSPNEEKILVISDKGTVHIFYHGSGCASISHEANASAITSTTLSYLGAAGKPHIHASLPPHWQQEMSSDIAIWTAWLQSNVYCLLSNRGRYLKFYVVEHDEQNHVQVECLLEAQRQFSAMRD